MDQIDLIDVSLEDDFLISSSSKSLPDPTIPAGLREMMCHVNDYSHHGPNRKEELESSIIETKQLDQVPQFSESPEQTRKTNKVNLRKSLACDSAFFTSEGVLNNEELAMVNSTYRKKELNMLPQIEEDLRRSADSSSTIDSDSWALENLETDLFDNLQASIQKSCGNSDKASNVLHPSRRQEQQLDPPNPASSRKFETSSIKMNQLKKPGSSKTKREETLVNAMLSKQLTNKVEVSKSLVKPPKVISRTSNAPIAPTKGTSDSGTVNSRFSNTKVLTGSSTARQSFTSLKNLQMDARSSKPSSLTSSKKLQIDARNANNNSFPKPSRLSHGGVATQRISYASNSKSLHSRGQPAQEITRKKQDSKTTSSSLSISSTKAPSRLSKDKFVLRNQGSAASQKPLIGSSSVSPASSLDSLASESSSIFCGSQASCISEGSDFSSSKLSIETQFDKPQLLDLHKSSIGQNSGTSLPHQSRPKASLAFSGTAQLSSGCHVRSSVNTSSKGMCSKPSGLRMPRPKIGYFDGAKLQNQTRPSRAVEFPKTTGSSVLEMENKASSTKPLSFSSGGLQAESRKYNHGTTDGPPKHLPRASELQLTPSSTGKTSILGSETHSDLSGQLGKRNKLNSPKVEEVEAVEHGHLYNSSEETDISYPSLQYIAIDPVPNGESLNFVSSGVQCKNSQESQQTPQAGEKEKIDIYQNKLHSVEKSVNEKENWIPGDQTPSLCKYPDSENQDNALLELVEKNMSLLCLSVKEELNAAVI